MANSKYWCFTINNPTEEDKPLEWDVEYVLYQLEKGEQGTPHYQGYVELAKRVRLSAMKKINGRAAWYARKGTQDQAVAYCKKQDTRVDGPWEKGSLFQGNQGSRTDLDRACEAAAEGGISAVIAEHATAYAKYHAGLEKIAMAAQTERVMQQRKRQFSEAELRPWQEQLKNKLEEDPDDRKIMWYWENNGNVGKTWMAKYLQAQYGATVLDCSKKADLAYMLRGHAGNCVVFNVVRSMDEQFMGHVYGLAEAIKDDLVMSTKYECTAVPLGKQHVVVFANQEPDYQKWSEDRYCVTEINTVTPFTIARQNKRARNEPEPNCQGDCDEHACLCAQKAGL